MLEAIEKPNSFFLLPKSSRKFIYDRAFGGYSFGDEFHARFEVTSANFKTVDDFLIQAFFNFVASNTEIVKNNGNVVRGFKDAAFDLSDEISPDLATNINSPGFLDISARSLAPLVANALLLIALTVDPVVAVEAAKSGKLTIGNSSAPNDPCTAEVDHQVLTQIKLLILGSVDIYFIHSMTDTNATKAM